MTHLTERLLTMTNAYAPQFHFLPKKGWINDPNGLVYFQNTWHLFYQYYEPSEVDGMQWGHARSSDLINWEHLPPAIQPDQHGQIWSGSAVVDKQNSSGLFPQGSGIVCLFTYWDSEDHRQSQGLAYSSDGVNFETYEGNPIIPQMRYLDGHPDDKDFRDPKVFWHEETQKWIMVIAGGKLRIFSSTDLIHWEFESIDEELRTECPDLFQMAIDGDQNNKTWLLSFGGRGYRLGDFDGKRFTPTSAYLPMTFGPDFYAGQSWSDAPDDRRIMISWLYGWSYESGPDPKGVKNPFPTGEQAGSCLSLPYELSLVTTDKGVRLKQLPISEADTLFDGVQDDEVLVVNGEQRFDSGRSFSFSAVIDSCASESLVFSLDTHEGGKIHVGYNQQTKRLFIDRRDCGFAHLESFARYVESDVLELHQGMSVQFQLVVDACSVEIFALHGLAHMAAFAPITPDAQLRCCGEAELRDVSLSLAKSGR